MSLETTRKAYNEVFETLKKYKDVYLFDVQELEHKSNLHLFGIELNEVYGLNIDPKNISSFDWISFGEYLKIAWYGEKYNRKISWSDDGRQPKDELIVLLTFPTGAFIFGDGSIFDKDYPVNFFNKFWVELLSYKPDYIDTMNSGMYWKIENAKSIFNSFNDILKKYYSLNKEDIKQRRIEKMKADLLKLESEQSSN